MNSRTFINKVIIGLWLTCTVALVHAGTPLWTFTPLTQTTITIASNDTATVSYQVTNQSRRLHTLAMRAIPGVTQVTTPGNCSSLFVLGYQQSCTLTLSVNGSSLSENVIGGPVVCQQGNALQCYQPSLATSLNISKNKSSNHTVAGNIAGLTGTVTLLNNGSNSTPISTDGNFTFSTAIAEGSTYAVTVGTQPADQTCTVVNGSGTMGGANVTNVTVTCATNAYTVGGSVTGLTGTVTLLNNGSNSTPINADGNFTFSTPIAEGSTYAVTVGTQPATQTCSVANGSGPMGGANVTNVTVTCATNAFTVGGNVTGLTGTVTLLNNATNLTPISTDGPFTFSLLIADGSPYAVTIQTQPATQTCSVNNSTGIISGSNIMDVDVTCVTNTTISAPQTGTIPVDNGTNTFTVTNNGALAALNVRAILPGAWTVVNGVIQDSSDCTSIPPGDTCTLVFSSNLPFVAQGGIMITGDNISSPAATALAFTATPNNYLIWAVLDPTTVEVIDTANLLSSLWGGNGTIGVGAQNVINGESNTLAIVSALGSGSSYAARACNQSTNGGASIGAWYLPAICQMGGSGQAAVCSFGLANIDTNLVQLGFGGLAGYYWSSTEYSLSSQRYAWVESFASSGGSGQDYYLKDNEFGVRCSRALTL